MKWILMPGMDGTGDLFSPLTKAIPPHYSHTVLSYPQDPKASYETLTEHVLSALPQDEPFILVAESFSGPLALLVAQQRPKGLKAVVLCATFVLPPLRFARQWMSPLVQPLWFALTPSALMTRLLLGPKKNPELRNTLKESLRKASPAVLAGRARAVLALDAADALKACPVPILYLRATRDRIVFPQSLKQILDIRDTVTVAEFDSPHLLLQTCPTEAAKVISHFVQTHDKEP